MSRKYLAEFIGTFGLVFCGTGAIVINQITNGEIGHIGIAITFGLIVLTMIYTFGDISGAHFNPAVTIAFWFAGKFEGKQIIPYLLSQLAGAFIANLTLKLMFPDSSTLGETLPHGSPWTSFILEIILTFFLMLVIINVSTGAKEKGMLAGIAVGAIVLLEALFAGPISGASMNPFRSLTPAILSGNLQFIWIYLIAPVIGAIVAILVCIGTKGKECCENSIVFKLK
ncbi:MAG: MIP/aquaporin family protein [Bacteroidia bacterium]